MLRRLLLERPVPKMQLCVEAVVCWQRVAGVCRHQCGSRSVSFVVLRACAFGGRVRVWRCAGLLLTLPVVVCAVARCSLHVRFSVLRLRQVLFCSCGFWCVVVMFARFAVAGLFCGSVALGEPDGTLPVVDVRLAQPSAADLGLAEAVGEVEVARGVRESQAVQSDVRAFNAALRAAKPQVESAVRRVVADARALARSSSGAGFLGVAARAPYTMEVDVAPGLPAVGSPVASAIRELEGAWSAHESRMFGSWAGDYAALTDFVLSELRAPSAGQVAAGPLPEQVSTRDVFGNGHAAAGAVASVVGAAEQRHDLSEVLARSAHLSLQLSFLQRLNEFAEEALRVSVAGSAA